MFCRSAASCRRPRTPAEPPRHTPTPVPRACSVTRRNTPLPTPPHGPRRTRRRARLRCRAVGLLQSRPRPRRHCPCITQRFIHPNQPTVLRACTCQGTDEVGTEQALGLVRWLGVKDLNKSSLTACRLATRRQWCESSATPKPRDRQGHLNNSADFAPGEPGRMPAELRSSHQAVAHAADCLDAVGADLGAQVADVYADHV